jgi:hypothetical protein
MAARLKVLGFDSWTGGWFNFARLLPALAERNMSLKVVHIGSWGSDPGRPNEEVVGGVAFKDVAGYAHRPFDEILDLERPDAVLMLSTQTYAHRAFLRYCRQRGIPTLHLYHGIANVQVTDDTVGSHKIDFVSYARYALPKVGKLFRRTFPCYVKALLATRARPSEWLRFASDVLRQMRAAPALRASDDAATTRVVVYTEADVEHAVRIYGVAEKDVVAVGNPDLLRFGVSPADIGALNRRTDDLDGVMYVDTALSIVGLLYASHASFLEHLRTTGAALQRAGKRLLFKPHPAHDVAALERELGPAGVEIVANDRFVARLKQCCACISEATSVSLIPALTGIPMLLAAYGELAEQRFGRVLKSYPRAHMLHDLADFGRIMENDAAALDTRAVADWIAHNSGPMPAEDMPRRVVAAIEAMIAEAAAARAG